MASEAWLVYNALSEKRFELAEQKFQLQSQSGVDERYKKKVAEIIDDYVGRLHVREKWFKGCETDRKLDASKVVTMKNCEEFIKGDLTMLKVDLMMEKRRCDKRVYLAKDRESAIRRATEAAEQEALDDEYYVQSREEEILDLKRENDDLEMSIFEDLLNRVKPK